MSRERAVSKRTNKAAPTSSALAPGQRWSVARKRDVVMRILRGEPLDDLSREYGVEVVKLEQWRDRAVAGIEAGLKDRTGDPVEAELENAKARLGELVMENELLRGRAGPFGLRRLRK